MVADFFIIQSVSKFIRKISLNLGKIEILKGLQIYC